MGIAEERFTAIWPVHVESLIEFLTRLRAAFDGDLDTALILAVIGSGNMARSLDATARSCDSHKSDPARFGGARPINTLSIAEISGVPRETVRRKLMAMQKRGWIARDSKGQWSAEPEAAKQLAPITQYSLDYLSRMLSISA